MRITWDEFTVPFKLGEEDLFSDWRWLVGETAQPILVTALGDAFMQETDGSVQWLDAGRGEYTKVAATQDEFKQSMAANADEWFVPQLVGDLIASDATLGPGQCFSFKKLPVLGGDYDPGNFEPTDLSVHFSLSGQIHQQVKDLPEGTRISSVQTMEP
jgi:hypothetical protein